MLHWGSVCTGIILIKFHPYKITAVHELKQLDCASRIRLCKWLLKKVHDGLVTVNWWSMELAPLPAILVNYGKLWLCRLFYSTYQVAKFCVISWHWYTIHGRLQETTLRCSVWMPSSLPSACRKILVSLSIDRTAYKETFWVKFFITVLFLSAFLNI
jgi:hypothetical protein